MPGFNLVGVKRCLGKEERKQCVYSRKTVPLNDRVAWEDTTMNIIGRKTHDKKIQAGSNLELLHFRKQKLPTPEIPQPKLLSRPHQLKKTWRVKRAEKNTKPNGPRENPAARCACNTHTWHWHQGHMGSAGGSSTQQISSPTQHSSACAKATTISSTTSD